MNITLDNSINRLGINVNAQNTIEKNIEENKIENCNSEANGVILGLSEETTQNKISSVYSKFLSYSSSAGMSEIKSAFGLDCTRTSYAELIYNAMS